MTTIDDVIAHFTALPDWQARYRALILLGKTLPMPNDEQQQAMTLLAGCEVPIFFQLEPTENGIKVRLYSQSRIINGLFVILLHQLDALDNPQALNIHATLAKCGISEHLSATRLAGLREIERQIKTALRANV
ncbi:SufE family protein [Spirabiliibacterium falconis]|uniref:SufE family protein n=1 Tax=Spirabiliibacterium falconis TaxID=572023 RepID=UPI001AAC4F74|nr:SufE family protein [Spirabiliibacterium falconis]MBE2894199.1 SufE family protein [Spirabiliibacterium falconis]